MEVVNAILWAVCGGYFGICIARKQYDMLIMSILGLILGMMIAIGLN